MTNTWSCSANERIFMSGRFFLCFIMGFSSVCCFTIAVILSISSGFDIDERLWAGHEGSNSLAQILWFISIPFAAVYFYLVSQMEYPLTRGISVFVFHCRKIGLRGKAVLILSILLGILCISGCLTNISVQVYDRYYTPSCYYKSPC